MTDTSTVQAVPTPAAIPAPEKPDKRGDTLAYGALGLMFYVVTLVFVVVIAGVKIDPVSLTLATMVVTAVIATAGAVYSFQYGSSKGSQVKDAAIAAAPTPATPPTTP